MQEKGKKNPNKNDTRSIQITLDQLLMKMLSSSSGSEFVGFPKLAPTPLHVWVLLQPGQVLFSVLQVPKLPLE